MGKYTTGDDRRRANTSTDAARKNRANNPGRATTGGGYLYEPLPNDKKWPTSRYPVCHVVFNTPVGSYDQLKDAMAACRTAKIPYRDEKDNPAITISYEDRPVRGPITKGRK